MPVFVPLLIIVAIAVIAILVFGCSASLIGYGLLKTTAKFGSSAPAPTPTPKPSSSGWTFLYSPNMPQQMWDNGDGTYYFDFPSKDGCHYVVRPFSASVGQTITMIFNLSGNGTLAVSDPADIAPATVRFHLEGSAGVNDRWFQHVGTNLTDGDHTVSLAITADNFGPVGGGATQPTDFATSVANLASAGMCFGGQYFAGHGVYVTGGSKRFTLKSFTIT